MRKLKYVLAILAAILIVAGGALLPRIVARMQDAFTNEKIYYSDMNSVQLNFTEQAKFIPIIGKLSLLQNGTVYELTEKEATLSEDEVYKILTGALNLYFESGLILCDFSEFEFQMVPALACDVHNADLYFVFWSVSMAVSEFPYHQLNIILDDETGTILFISYEVGDFSLEGIDLYGQLDVLYSIYFEALGLLPPDNDEIVFESREAVGAEFRFGDVEYGEVSIELYTTSHGFYCSFPSR